MMKLIISIALLVLVTACTVQTPVDINAQRDDSSVGALGTLADANNPAEMKASPVVTHLAMFLNRAKKHLHRKQITVDSAIAARDCADRLRAIIDDAVKRSDINTINAISSRIGECESIIEVKP
ncbi:MAG: hypothetical protein Q8L15_06925 [Methylobacter sp.]|nr:hypothetical protein [Methylobacter sp.]